MPNLEDDNLVLVRRGKSNNLGYVTKESLMKHKNYIVVNLLQEKQNEVKKSTVK